MQKPKETLLLHLVFDAVHPEAKRQCQSIDIPIDPEITISKNNKTMANRDCSLYFKLGWESNLR